jgi:hypothetical protein
VDPVAAVTLPLAHGGVPGAIAEACVTLLVLGLFVAVWHRRKGDDDDDDE